jgi:hypothetical protein
MDNKRCQFKRCHETARPGWRYCSRHIQVMYRRMLEEGYLEPWPEGEEPPLPQDLTRSPDGEADPS